MKTLVCFAVFLCVFGCAYTPNASNVAPGTSVGATGEIRYDYQSLGGRKHLLIVTAAPGMMETESSIAQRILIFANKFAAEKCPDGFDFVSDPNFDQKISSGWMKRTKTYVFTERPKGD